MKLEDVLLTERQIRLIVNNRGTWSSVRDDTMALITAEKAAKAQCLKLLDVLNKILYEICPHKEYPQRNKIDCALCVMECMSELEKLLKEG